ncbi:hypothetical protein TNCV_4903951 [Trichonephila clavipes]|nr:hypothetical protein TNCV_4903951 [Trichonephila clavipes]
MAQHRPRKPASVEYTTDEEDLIVYGMGEEIESPKNGSTVGESKKDIAKYTYITPTKYKKTATAVVESGRPIFDDFFQHLWPYIGNNTVNVVFQMVKRLWLIRIDQ